MTDIYFISIVFHFLVAGMEILNIFRAAAAAAASLSAALALKAIHLILSSTLMARLVGSSPGGMASKMPQVAVAKQMQMAKVVVVTPVAVGVNKPMPIVGISFGIVVAKLHADLLLLAAEIPFRVSFCIQTLMQKAITFGAVIMLLHSSAC